MKLQVPLTIAAMLWTWLAASADAEGLDDRNAAADARLEGDGSARRPRLAKIVGPCSARSALLAVTTCLPRGQGRRARTPRPARSPPSSR